MVVASSLVSHYSSFPGLSHDPLCPLTWLALGIRVCLARIAQAPIDESPHPLLDLESLSEL